MIKKVSVFIRTECPLKSGLSVRNHRNTHLEPTYILLRFGELKDELNSGLIERCYLKSNDNDYDLVKELDTYEKLLDLKPIEDKEYANNDLSIKINEHSITISNEKFKDIILDYGNEREITFNQYLNFKSAFVINFNKVEFVYTHRKIFRDSKFLGDIENFLTTFLPYNELGKITSEKGSGYNSGSTSFSKDSLFYFIESTLASKHKCLICDDLGPEWGDFISLNDEEIIFYHAKHHNFSLSATNLEEVFGQAQKNFGYLSLTSEMIDYRSSKWLQNYNINHEETNIKRIRKCTDNLNPIESIKAYNDMVSLNPNLRRKVYIVASFLSKKELGNSIEKVKNGNRFANKGVTVQILWFVNSLLASANDLGAEFRVICRP